MAGINNGLIITRDSDYRYPDEIISKDAIFEFYRFYVCKATKYSANSVKKPFELANHEKELLLSTLLSHSNISEDNFVVLENALLNLPQNAQAVSNIIHLQLDDTSFCVNSEKGFFLAPSGHKLDWLLNHIRDSFAHARIAKQNGFIILEDKKPGGTQLTARLVLLESTLLRWVNIIEDFMK
ncbi:MAG: hypothetical protein LBN30_01635 [Oscillospiraceae bacterium]|jgi:hypothetical protein|nr:hypothetical protein [Oscillospiraceae bacterium]